MFHGIRRYRCPESVVLGVVSGDTQILDPFYISPSVRIYLHYNAPLHNTLTSTLSSREMTLMIVKVHRRDYLPCRAYLHRKQPFDDEATAARSNDVPSPGLSASK